MHDGRSETHVTMIRRSVRNDATNRDARRARLEGLSPPVPGDWGWNGLNHSFETATRQAVPICPSHSWSSIGNGAIPFPYQEAPTRDPWDQMVRVEKGRASCESAPPLQTQVRDKSSAAPRCMAFALSTSESRRVSSRSPALPVARAQWSFNDERPDPIH